MASGVEILKYTGGRLNKFDRKNECHSGGEMR
jgi:hypothetical protein